MSDLIYLILLFLIGIGLVLVFSRSAREKTVGICAVVLGQSTKKRENKEKILAILQKRARSNPSGQGELSNADVREALGVSPRTVVSYMDELEKEGKVEQAGNIGQNVRYRFKA